MCENVDVCSYLYLSYFRQIYHSYHTAEYERDVLTHVTLVLIAAGLVDANFQPTTVIVMTWSNVFGKGTEGCAAEYNNKVKLGIIVVMRRSCQ